MKLYPLPKIEFDEGFDKAHSMNFDFYLDEKSSEEWRIIVEQSHSDYDEININSNIEFEQAVTEWVSAWVKENFPGIVVPDIQIEYDSLYEDGHNDCIHELLELNPNCIRETE